ncbi:hypothetical protein Glove_476g14 [Diversispora epigaea]|uniref:Uncharacterized protein n=1 Tax=Diversispora epigaea TaxID=1348612 RepID=A0A397GMV7_9GLOM|nr:hypothetical protein Glove_476g14 [Diversispora epigaea]
MSDQLKIAKRPKEPAKNGRIVRVKVNYLEVIKFNFPSVKSYSFDIDDAKRKPLKKEERDEVMAAFLKSKSPEITAAHYGSLLYSYKDILNGSKTKNYRFPHKDCLGAPQNYNVKIKFSSEIRLDITKKFIKGDSNLSWEDIQENLNVYNSYLNTKAHTMLPHLSSKSKAIFPEREQSRKIFLPDCLGAPQNYNVKIKFSSEIRLDITKKFIKGDSNLSWEDIQENLNVYNSYLNTKAHTMLPHLSSKSKAIFPEREQSRKIFLPGGSEILSGFMQSIRLGWENLYVNIDICNALVIPEGNLLKLLPKFLGHDNFASKNLFESEIENLTRRLKGYKFCTTYDPRRRTIARISSKSAYDLKFERDGKMIRISEYFEETGTPLKYSMLPCVVVIKKQGRNEREIYFPIEVCLLKFGQKIPQSSMTNSMQKEMIRKTAISPDDRFTDLEIAMKEHYDHNNNEYLKSIGLEVANKFMELDSRVIEGPNVIVGGEKEIKPKLGDWDRDLTKFKKCATINKWSVVVFAQAKTKEIEKIMDIFDEVISEKGIVVKNKPRILHFHEPIATEKLLYKEIPLVEKKLKEATKNGEELVVCILDKKTTGDNSLYAVVKRTCLTIIGVMSQCFLWPTFKGESEKKIKNVFSMVAPKLNTKLDGVNCSLSEELNFKSKKAMIMGADVYHPGPIEKAKGHPSVAAVCASMNSDATKYASRYRLNKFLKNETIEKLSEMTKELLIEFKKRNQYLPDHIIFYRDGVAEGQFEKIMKEEVKVLKDSLQDFYGKSGIQEPKITFMIMQKRHHMRCVPVNKEEAHPDTGNSLPGTIIDLKIVVADEFSFFLLSQALVQKGTTARSSYYRILLNEGDFTADEIQKLTYNLCYLSARCNVSISQVAPACYAHHIANQARYLVEFSPYNVANSNRGNGNRRGGRGGLGGGRVGLNNSSHQKRPLVRNGSWDRVTKNIENRMWFL